MLLLPPLTMLQPSIGLGFDDRTNQPNGPDLERECIPRGVPLRQRQLPASFWQEPNRAWPPPPSSGGPAAYGPMHVVPQDPAASQRLPTDYAVSWTGMPGTAPTDYGYGPAAASVLPSLPCSCPHCTEKHYRAAQMAAYPWSGVPDSDVKPRVDGWMWAAAAAGTPSNPKGPQGPSPAVMAPFQNPYGVPVSVGTTVGMGSPMEVGDAYASAGHPGAFWKTNPNGTVSGTGYWSMPYSFN